MIGQIRSLGEGFGWQELGMTGVTIPVFLCLYQSPEGDCRHGSNFLNDTGTFPSISYSLKLVIEALQIIKGIDELNVSLSFFIFFLCIRVCECLVKLQNSTIRLVSSCLHQGPLWQGIFASVVNSFVVTEQM